MTESALLVGLDTRVHALVSSWISPLRPIEYTYAEEIYVFTPAPLSTNIFTRKRSPLLEV